MVIGMSNSCVRDWQPMELLIWIVRAGLYEEVTLFLLLAYLFLNFSEAQPDQHMSSVEFLFKQFVVYI